MHKFRIIFILIWGMLFNHPIGYAFELTESMVLASTQIHYPEIQASITEYERAKANYLSAKGGFDPVIKSYLITSPIGFYHNIYSNTEISVPILDSGNRLISGYRIGRGNFPVYDQDRETYRHGEVRLGLEVPLLRDRLIDTRRIKIQEGEVKQGIALKDLQVTKLLLQREASIAYWTWYGEAKKFILQNMLLDLANERQQALNKSLQVGDIPKIELIDNERIILQRKALLQAQNAFMNKAAYALSLFYRNREGQPILPELSNLPKKYASHDKLIALQSNYKQNVDSHPQIQKLNQEKHLYQLQLKAARNQKLPILNNRFFVAQDFGGGKPPLNRTSIYYEIILEFPLFQRQAKGEIIAAQELIRKIEINKKLEREKLIAAIQESINRINFLQTALTETFEEIAIALKVLEAENIRFSEGDSNILTLNEREIQKMQAEIRYVDLFGNYKLSLADLHFATNSYKDNA